MTQGAAAGPALVCVGPRVWLCLDLEGVGPPSGGSAAGGGGFFSGDGDLGVVRPDRSHQVWPDPGQGDGGWRLPVALVTLFSNLSTRTDSPGLLPAPLSLLCLERTSCWWQWTRAPHCPPRAGPSACPPCISASLAGTWRWGRLVPGHLGGAPCHRRASDAPRSTATHVHIWAGGWWGPGRSAGRASRSQPRSCL